MRYRKKLSAAALVLFAAYAAWCFWPHTNPEARRALESLREMVEVMPETAPRGVVDRKDNSSTQIEFAIVVAKINMTDATAGLFAKSVSADSTILGRVQSPQEFLEIAKSTQCMTIISEPRVMTLAGREASVMSGNEIAQLVPNPTGPSDVAYRLVGVEVHLIADVTDAGTVAVEIHGGLSRVSGVRTVPTAQGPVECPDVAFVGMSVRKEMRIGETLLIGGPAQKNRAAATFKMPLLSELPRVGSWFQFAWQREIEEELMILVTPQIISPVGMR